MATITETVEPLPGSGPVKAALPVSDAAISTVPSTPHAGAIFMVEAGASQFKQR
jgi:hypothetical protein